MFNQTIRTKKEKPKKDIILYIKLFLSYILKKDPNSIYYLAICLLTIAFFWQFFFKGLYPFPGDFLMAWHEPYRSQFFIDGKILLPHKPLAEDVFRQIYPFKILAIDMVKNGHLPLWNPYNGSGMPLMATINSGFFDPLNIFFFIFSYPLAWSFLIITQFFSIALATFIYLQKIKLSPKASLLGSFLFSLSGFVSIRLMFGMYGTAIAILPLLLFIYESYIQNSKIKKFFLMPFVILILLVSSQPQISLYILVFTFVYFVFRSNQISPKSQMVKNTVFPILLMILGIGLAAFQLIPTLELQSFSNIKTESSATILDQFLVPFVYIISFFIPNYFGNQATYNFWGYGDYIQTLSYVGLIASFLAYFSFTNKIRDLTKDLRLFYLGTILLSVLLAVDWLGSRTILSLPIPLLSTGAPSRIFLLSTFSFAILAGYGFEFLKIKQNIMKMIIKVLPFVIFIAILAGVTFFLYQNNYPCRLGVVDHCRLVASRNSILELGVFSVFILLFLSYFIFKNKKYSLVLYFGILIIITFIGTYNATKTTQFVPFNWIFPKHEVSTALTKYTKDGRLFGIDEATIPTNFATHFRFYDPQHYHPLYIERYRQLIEYANNGKYEPILPRGDVSIRNYINPNKQLEYRRNRLFEILGVNYLIFKNSQIPESFLQNLIWKDGTFAIFNDKNVLPRAYIVENTEIIKDNEQILKRLFDKNFDFKKTVILEETINIPKSSKILSYSINKTNENENASSFNVSTNKEALFILVDNYYPGWKAFVNKKETPIYRANYTFRAIKIPEGKNTVKFSYKPNSFKSGIIISIISLTTIIVLFYIKTSFIKLKNR